MTWLGHLSWVPPTAGEGEWAGSVGGGGKAREGDPGRNGKTVGDICLVS